MGCLLYTSYLGKQELRIRIPVREDVDTDAVKAAEHALSAMYFEKEAYLSEPVRLNLDSFAEEPVEMVLTPDRFTGPKNYRILPGQKQIHLFHADEVPSSFYYFRVEVAVSGLVIGKVIGTYSFNTCLLYTSTAVSDGQRACTGCGFRN